jgi:integrase
MISKGINPSQTRKEKKQHEQQRVIAQQRLAEGMPLENSFTDIANRWLDNHQHTVSPSTLQNTKRRMENHIFPSIGNMPISEIKASHVRDMVLFISDKKQAVETAHRVLTDCGRIFRFAIAHDLIEHDPSYAVKDALPPVKVTHRAAITDPRQIGQLVRDIDNYEGTFVVQCALKITPLIFARPGEIRQMEWNGKTLTLKKKSGATLSLKQALNRLSHYQSSPLKY